MGTRETGIAGHQSDEPRRRLTYPSVLEDRVAAHHREIQSLLVGNQALKQDLSYAQQDLRHLSNVKAEREAQCGRSLKLEVELRSIDAMSAELAQVQWDVQKLAATRQELTGELKAMDVDIANSLSEACQLPVSMEEIEGMRREIPRGRAAFAYEKKTHARNLEHAKVMEKNMTSDGS